MAPSPSSGRPRFPEGFFARADERADAEFYAEPRRVVHLDEGAIGAVRRLYAEVLPADGVVLDLMSSWRSHLPEGLARRVVGLGMNAEEMADNPQLDDVVVHDLNRHPTLAWPDASFDAVVCCVSVQYLVRPVEVFAEVARVLRSGSPFVVTFSNRCFPPKAIAAWLYTGDDEHLALVRDYFGAVPAFVDVRDEDRSPGGGDPLYAVRARRATRPGGDPVVLG